MSEQPAAADAGEAEKGAATPAEDAPTTAVDDALTSAEATRKVAQFIATGFAVIPTLAVLTSLVRAPGDAGVNAAWLTIGVCLIAIGVIGTTLGVASVLVPVRLRDQDLMNTDFSMAQVPGSPYQTYDEMSAALATTRHAATEAQAASRTTKADADRAAALAEAAVKRADWLAEQAKEDNSPDLQRKVSEARVEALELGRLAAVAKAAAVLPALDGDRQSEQVAALLRLRADAFRLKAAEVVGGRYNSAATTAFVCTLLVAVGIVFLALAPNPKSEPANVALLTLSLNDDGQKAICAQPTIQALQIGGTDEVPTVITLPAPGCPSVQLDFPTAGKKPLGEIVPAE